MHYQFPDAKDHAKASVLVHDVLSFLRVFVDVSYMISIVLFLIFPPADDLDGPCSKFLNTFQNKAIQSAVILW